MENKIEKYLGLVLSSDFPYPKFSDGILKRDYAKLLVAGNKNAGQKLVQHFHPSIWRCNRHGYLSPLEAWSTPEVMYKVIENRLKYLDTDELSIYHIRNGLYISGKAPKVSIFRPSLAKCLIEKYLSEYNTIFDPCCGYSGRMLGACALNKKYIGQDINSITIKESKQLRDFLGLDAELKVNDSLYDSGEYECLFTCPPYGAKENWAQDIEVLSADEWIDICLKNYTCKAYLFVVDKTDKYKGYIVDSINNTSHFGTNEELIILIKK